MALSDKRNRLLVMDLKGLYFLPAVWGAEAVTSHYSL